MDSNANKKTNTEIDIRDVTSFLINKLWIIALVVLSFVIISFIYTKNFVTPMYSSTTSMLVYDDSSQNTTASMTNGQKITSTAPQIIKGDFCDIVAQKLNELEANDPFLVEILGEEDGAKSFKGLFNEYVGTGITGSQIRAAISVYGDEDSPLVSVVATTLDPRLSAVISNAVLTHFEDYVPVLIEGTPSTIATTIYEAGKIPTTPSNISLLKNMMLAAVVGGVLVCAILIVIFIFDDKIKTPDDIQKHLGISILGTIPEIEEA